MKQIMEEYGVAILEAVATVALLGLFAMLVFSPGSLMSDKLVGFVSGYAGEAGAIDKVSAKEMVISGRNELPEPCAVNSVHAKMEYSVSDVFDIPKGYTLRVTRASLLDDLENIETDAGRGNMALQTYDVGKEDMTVDICRSEGQKLIFPERGYYSLMVACADTKGHSTTGVYLVSVRA
ncbi:MAG: hypothetical protein K6B14_09280 [Lachnospiraceae bacterium]|nr:hypothetical protein [Lachnospiraceae bacterium]